MSKKGLTAFHGFLIMEPFYCCFDTKKKLDFYFFILLLQFFIPFSHHLNQHIAPLIYELLAYFDVQPKYRDFWSRNT